MINRRFLCLALGAAALGARLEAAPSPAWTDALAAPEVRAADLTDDAVWTLAMPDGRGGWTENAMRASVRPAAGGSWEFLTAAASIRSLVALDAGLQFRSEIQEIIDPVLIARYGVDRFEWRRETDRAAAVYYLAGAVKQSVKVEFAPGAAFMQALPLQLRALLLAGRNGSYDLSLVIGAQRVDAAVAFIRSDDVLSLAGGYAYPAAMRARLSGRNFLAAELRLKGIYALAYPHRFYSVFDPADGFRYAAGWGGNPADCQFQWRLP
jgi:hypothetical protein